MEPTESQGAWPKPREVISVLLISIVLPGGFVKAHSSFQKCSTKLGDGAQCRAWQPRSKGGSQGESGVGACMQAVESREQPVHVGWRPSLTNRVACPHLVWAVPGLQET